MSSERQDIEFLIKVQDAELKKLEAELKKVTRTLETTGTVGASQTTKMSKGFSILGDDAEKSAARHVAAGVRTRKALQEQLAVYERVARTAQRGSHEQVTASILAGRAAKRLGRETEQGGAQGAAGWSLLGRSARNADRDVQKGVRGLLSASGIFGRFRNSLAFASTAFIGGAGAGFAARSIYDESTKAERIQKSLRAQLDATGISWRRRGKEIDGVVAKQSRFAAVDDEEVKAALTGELRTTGSLTAAYRLNSLALDVSAGSHVGLATGAKIVARVFGGNLGILKRYGIVLGSNVKTPLQALIALQAKFAGQAAAAGDSTAGAFERAQNSIHNFEEGVGSGALPVIARELNSLTGAIDDPSLQAAGQRLGASLAESVGGAITSIVTSVHRNWPEIKRDIGEASDLAKELATDLDRVAGAVSKLGRLNPAGGGSGARTLLDVFAAYKVLKLAGKVGIGKDAATDAAGLSAAAKEARSFGSALARIKSIAGTGLAITIAVDYLIHKKQVDAKFDRNHLSIIPDAVDFFTLGNPAPLVHDITHPWDVFKSRKPSDDAAAGTRDNKKAIDDTAAAYGRAHGIMAGTWRDVSNAIRDQGILIAANRAQLEKLATTAKGKLDAAFSAVADRGLQAFDAATQRLDDTLQVRVRVANESFLYSQGIKTPAERELDALDKLDRRRQLQRDTVDARQELRDARKARKALNGQTQDVEINNKIYTFAATDPQQIKDANKRVRDAKQRLADLREQRLRDRLEARATIEQAAAAKVLAQSLKDLNSKRDLIRTHLVADLDKVNAQLDAGKIKAGKARDDVLAILARYGVSIRSASSDLGKYFAVSIVESLTSVEKEATRVYKLLKKIDDLKTKLAGAKEDAANAKAAADRMASEPKPNIPPAPSSSKTPKRSTQSAAPVMQVEHLHVNDRTEGEVLANKIARALAYR
ncbi:MAG: hypothetical protein ACJ76I_11880 [Gaiellaceae bacterium]